jgi:hypothetical protein
VLYLGIRENNTGKFVMKLKSFSSELFLLQIFLLIFFSNIVYAQNLVDRATSEKLISDLGLHEKGSNRNPIQSKTIHDIINQNRGYDIQKQTTGSNRNLSLAKTKKSISKIVYTPLVRIIDDTARARWIYYDNYESDTVLFEKYRNGTWVPTYRTTDKYDYTNNSYVSTNESYANDKWIGEYRESYTFLNNGNILTFLMEEYNGSVWVGDYRYTQNYDSNNNLIDFLKEAYTSGAWSVRAKITYKYAENDLLTSTEEDYSAGIQSGGCRYTYTYNNSHKLLTKIQEEYTNGTWTNYSRWINTYDDNNNLITEIGAGYENDAWKDGTKNTMTYDIHNNMTTYLWENYKYGLWVGHLRENYSYDSKNNMLSQIGYEYNDTTAKWGNTFSNYYTYDNNNNKLTDTHQAFTGISGWSFWGQRCTYTYDSNNNELTEYWDQYKDSVVWYNLYWIHYVYDNNGNAIHVEASNTIQKFVVYYNNMANSMALYELRKVDVTYSSYLGVEGKSNALNTYNLAQNYPNPFNPTTTINYTLKNSGKTVLKVYSMIGNRHSC